MNTVEQWKEEKHPLDVVEDVKRYAEEGMSFEEIAEESGEGEFERLKWAGMYTHGVHDDYYMRRTKVRGGTRKARRRGTKRHLGRRVRRHHHPPGHPKALDRGRGHARNLGEVRRGRPDDGAGLW